MTFRRTAHLRTLLLLGFLGAAPAACVDTEDGVLLASPTPPTAAGVTGLASGCEDGEPPVGRLRGLVYSLPLETRQLPDFGALRPIGTVCMDRLAVTERRGYPGFPGLRSRFEWFGVDFEGAFVVTEPGLFHFRLTSDDGSKLYIDGAPIIDNDGFHWTRAAEGAVYLAAGPHGIDVPYWQGPGPLALILEVARPGDGYDVFQADRPLEGASP
jgi:hypothetical protein